MKQSIYHPPGFQPSSLKIVYKMNSTLRFGEANTLISADSDRGAVLPLTIPASLAHSSVRHNGSASRREMARLRVLDSMDKKKTGHMLTLSHFQLPGLLSANNFSITPGYTRSCRAANTRKIMPTASISIDPDEAENPRLLRPITSNHLFERDNLARFLWFSIHVPPTGPEGDLCSR